MDGQFHGLGCGAVRPDADGHPIQALGSRPPRAHGERQCLAAGRLGTVTKPTLVVWGAADRIADSEYGRALAGAIPGARFELLAETGHLPQIETPEALIRVLWEFADRLLTGKPAS